MIILASKSPRRKELLGRVLNNFIIVPSNIDESLYDVNFISLKKCELVADLYPNDIVIAADTFIKFNDKILGKPKDKQDAINTLLSLSNKQHDVTTYYTIIIKNKNVCINKHVTTTVYMNNLSLDLVLKYVDTLSPLDKAGSYGIQDNDKYPLIYKIEGDYNNVVGLPLDEIKKDLILLGVKLKNN